MLLRLGKSNPETLEVSLPVQFHMEQMKIKKQRRTEMTGEAARASRNRSCDYYCGIK